MKQNLLMNKNALTYLFISKFLKSVFGFSLFVLVFTSAVLLFGLLTGSGLAEPLLDDSFSWSSFSVQVFAAVLVSSLIYGFISALIYRSTKVVKLDESGLEIESGVVLKRTDLIPYSQIKRVEAKQSPLQKMLSFVTLSIDYGGWDTEEVEHLAMDKALRLKTQLTKHSALSQ